MRGFPDLPIDIESDNPFYAGFASATLIKAEEEGSKWVVYLEASNEQQDQEEEITVMKALKDAANYYMTHGVISWDHQHKLQKDPAYIIGEPLDVAFTSAKSTLVKAMLYKENKRAQGVMENVLSKTSRFGASIGGYILKKAIENAQKFIRRVIWDDTAITHKPVNDTTLGHVQLVPFTSFAKSLTAGGGVDASSFSGGRALIGESLQGAKFGEPEMTKLFKAFLKGVKEGTLGSYQDTRAWVAETVPLGVSTDQVMNFIFAKLTKKS
ncbi:MAG: hypothetical protein C4K49_10625 [Candidatus Thorarchaeota archaeon]|nr:MAG: hypothetical protein C4K49_10625 [Candidatus Thorarchaeota archaeon]